MTVKEKILEILTAAEHPMSQIAIARAGNLNPHSVRRECQRLEATGKIVFAGDVPGLRFELPEHQTERLAAKKSAITRINVEIEDAAPQPVSM